MLPPSRIWVSPPTGPHEEAPEQPEHPAAVAAAGPCCPLVPRSTPWTSIAPRCNSDTPPVFSLPSPNSSFSLGLQIPWIQPPAPGAHFGCAVPKPPHQRATQRGLPAPWREGESPRGRKAAPRGQIHSPQARRAKPVPVRASPVAHRELWVPGQPCPTPPMVPRGPGRGGSSQAAGKFGAARTQLGVRVCPGTPAASQAPISAPKPAPRDTTRSRAPHGSDYQLCPPAALRGGQGGEVLLWGQGTHTPLDSLSPSQVPRPPPWQGPAQGLRMFDSHQPAGPPQHQGGKAGCPRAPGVEGHCPSADIAANTPPRAWPHQGGRLQGAKVLAITPGPHAAISPEPRLVNASQP